MIIVLRVFKCPGRHDPPWPDVHDDPVRPGDPGLSHRQRLLQDGLLPDPLWWRPGLHLPLHHQLRERRLPPADCLQYQQGRLCQTERWEDTIRPPVSVELCFILEPEELSSCDMKDMFAVSELTGKEMKGTWYVVRWDYRVILHLTWPHDIIQRSEPSLWLFSLSDIHHREELLKFSSSCHHGLPGMGSQWQCT